MTTFTFTIPPSADTMQVTINVAAAPSTLSTLVATPSSLSLGGTGQPTVGTVTFTGTDQYNNPVVPTISAFASSNIAEASATASGNVLTVTAHAPGQVIFAVTAV